MNQPKLVLIDKNGYSQVWVKEKERNDEVTFITFGVYTQDRWGIFDSDKQVFNDEDVDLIAEVTCKWDGCCHWNYADNNSYLHLCGPEIWERDAAMRVAVFNLARAEMISAGYDEYWGEPLAFPGTGFRSP